MFVSGKTLALWTVILLGAEALAKLADIAVSAAQLALASNYPETATAALGPENADVSEMPGGNFQVIVLLLDGTVTLFGLIVLLATAPASSVRALPLSRLASQSPWRLP